MHRFYLHIPWNPSVFGPLYDTIGIAAGAQPIVGYNYGAKKSGRVRELLGLIVKWTAVVCLICTILFEVFPLFFLQMSGADGALYTQFAVRRLRICLSLILFTCVQKACAIFLRSIGRAKAAAPLSIRQSERLLVFRGNRPGRISALRKIRCILQIVLRKNGINMAADNFMFQAGERRDIPQSSTI